MRQAYIACFAVTFAVAQIQPAWSLPDHVRPKTRPAPSRCIVFVRAGCIWTCRADGTGQLRLTTGGHDSKPVWRPGGGMVAFVRAGQKKDTSDIWVAGADGQRARRLSPADQNSWSAVWSPGGDMIAYVYCTRVSGRDSEWVGWLRPDGRVGDVALRLDDETRGFVDWDNWEACDWSPKGDQIAAVHRVHLGVCVELYGNGSGAWKLEQTIGSLRTGPKTDRGVMGYWWSPASEREALFLVGPGFDLPPIAQSCCLGTGDGTLVKDLLTVNTPDLEVGGMSPDGRYVVCSARGRILVIDVLTSMVRDIAAGKSPRWMPKLRPPKPAKPKEQRP